MEKTNKSVVVAITGGIGCGKSAVAGIITNLGFPVIFSDENAKIVMIENEVVRKKLIEAFGSEVYINDNKINSKYLSDKVFGMSDEHEKSLLKLNSIVHPVVIEKLISDVEIFENAGEKIIFVESALTYEAKLEEGFDFIIVVDAKEEIAIERIKARTGMNEEEILYRMNQQISQKMKVQQADFVIENNGSLAELKKSVEIIVNILSNFTS